MFLIVRKDGKDISEKLLDFSEKIKETKGKIEVFNVRSKLSLFGSNIWTHFLLSLGGEAGVTSPG